MSRPKGGSNSGLWYNCKGKASYEGSKKEKKENSIDFVKGLVISEKDRAVVADKVEGGGSTIQKKKIRV